MGYLRNRGTKGAPEWYIRFRDVDGKWKQRHSKATSKEGAKDVLAHAEARVKRGLVGMPEPTPEERTRATITVAELARHFLGEVEGEAGYQRPAIKDLEAYRGHAKSHLSVRVAPVLGARAAASVRLADVERLRDALLARGLAAASVKQTLAHLSKLYNWARRAGLVEVANPVSGVERPRAAASLDYLDKAEVAQLLAVAEDLARPGVASWETLGQWPMVATAVYCGLRKGELYGLRWADVNLQVGRLDVMRSYSLAPKSGDKRHVPIHPQLARILRSWQKLCPATPEGLVFPVEGLRGLRMGAEFDGKGIASLFAAAGCHEPADGHRWHMLRHTFAAHAVMSGASLYAVQRLMGHGSAAMTQRYAHLAPDYLAGEVARMNFDAPAPAGVTDINDARRRRGGGGHGVTGEGSEG